MGSISRRLLSSTYSRTAAAATHLPSLLSYHLFSSFPPSPVSSHTHNSITSRTHSRNQPKSCTKLLPQGFTPADVVTALLRSRSSPEAASHLFRWAAAQRGYRHTSAVYQTMLDISISRRRYSLAETLIDDIIAGACSDADLPLFNAIIRFCCSRKHLLSAFDVLKRMRQLGGVCRPSLETYVVILGAIGDKFDRFDRSSTRFVYMHSVRYLVRDMRVSGVIPDTATMNLVIKAYSRSLQVDSALKVFEEMSLYGCGPNEHSYGYLVEGLSDKGRVVEGLRFYKDMRKKGLVPTARVYMALINGLSMAKRFEEGKETMFDMLGNQKTPDLLTYRTLLEGLCREGKRSEAFELLEELKKKKRAMNQNAHSYLLEGLHWLCQDPKRI